MALCVAPRTGVQVSTKGAAHGGWPLPTVAALKVSQSMVRAGEPCGLQAYPPRCARGGLFCLTGFQLHLPGTRSLREGRRHGPVLGPGAIAAACRCPPLTCFAALAALQTPGPLPCTCAPSAASARSRRAAQAPQGATSSTVPPPSLARTSGERRRCCSHLSPPLSPTNALPPRRKPCLASPWRPSPPCTARHFCTSARFGPRPFLHLFRRDTARRRPPSYRVLLHNDSYNRREYVVQVRAAQRSAAAPGPAHWPAGGTDHLAAGRCVALQSRQLGKPEQLGGWSVGPRLRPWPGPAALLRQPRAASGAPWWGWRVGP